MNSQIAAPEPQRVFEPFVGSQSDQETKLEAQGKFLELLLGDRAHLLTEQVK